MFDEGQGVASKASDPKATLQKIMGILAPHKIALITVFILAVLSTSFSVIGPRVMGRVTTILVDGILAHLFGTGLLTDFRQMGFLTGILVGLYIVSSLCSVLSQSIMARVANKTVYKLRERVSEKMHKLPLNYYDTRTHGEVLSRLTNDIDNMSNTFGTSITQLINSSTALIGTLIMMISISPLMTASALVIIPASMMLMMVVLKRSYVYFGAQQEALGEVTSIVEETYSGHDVVRSYNGETDASAKFTQANKKLRASAWKAMFMSNLIEPVFNFVGNLGYVLVCVMGGWMVVQRTITIGDVQAFIQYIQSFTQPLAELGAASNQMQGTIAAAERVFEFLDEAEEAPDKSVSLHKEKYEGRVTFKNVRFGYDPEKIIINDFTQDVKPGQTVAIVGPTGAGKTTIVKLLMRFYELNSGSILIDGIDSTDMSRSELRDIFGMVLQDTWIYNASIMDNIRYGSSDATDEEVIAAAKAAHCHNFIKTLPGGYNMVLNEEASNISQGQKQLFTIARVVLKNPSILILDEATSSVDTRTEILIQKAMENVMQGRTSFVIAHRLSTIKNADLILVMKDGNIVEQGNHDELLKKEGMYNELYRSQFS